MKLIIDISEEVLDYLQPFKDICYQKIEEGTDSEHEHMLKALYEGILLDNVKAKIETDLSWDMFDEYGNETRLHKELMEILDNIGKVESEEV